MRNILFDSFVSSVFIRTTISYGYLYEWK